MSAFDIDDGKVRRGLYHAGVGRDIADDTIVAGEDGINQVVLNLYGHFLGGCGYILYENFDPLWLNQFELVVEGLFPVFGHFFQRGNILLGQRQHGLGLEGNGVAHVATVP